MESVVRVERERGMVNRDHKITSLIARVSKCILDLRLLARLRVREIVIAHRDRRIGVDDDRGILKTDGRPGLNRETMIFIDDAANEVGERFGLGQPKLLVRRPGRLEQNGAFIIVVQRIDMVSREGLIVATIRVSVTDGDDPVTPSRLRGEDIVFRDCLGDGRTNGHKSDNRRCRENSSDHYDGLPMSSDWFKEAEPALSQGIFMSEARARPSTGPYVAFCIE